MLLRYFHNTHKLSKNRLIDIQFINNIELIDLVYTFVVNERKYMDGENEYVIPYDAFYR